MRVFRFINSGFDNPYKNMAYDEALFTSYKRCRRPILRIYGWKPASFSLGYFQDASATFDIEKLRTDNISMVRRITGGGIIFHDNEITYSIICSDSDLGTNGRVKESYRVICSFIFNFYKKLTLKPRYAIDSALSIRRNCSFCFSSFEDYDIVIDSKKMGGNAQRRKKDVILQHGSIPLSLNFAMIKNYVREEVSLTATTSLQSLLLRNFDRATLIDLLKQSFQESFSCLLEETQFRQEEENLASFLEERKYTQDPWNINCSNVSCIYEKAGLA